MVPSMELPQHYIAQQLVPVVCALPVACKWNDDPLVFLIRPKVTFPQFRLSLRSFFFRGHARFVYLSLALCMYVVLLACCILLVIWQCAL